VNDLPRYADLPVVSEAPPGSAWGVFGHDDQLGTLNLLTAARRAAAASLVRRGATFNLDLPLDLPRRAFFPPRRPPHHQVLGKGTLGRDEFLDGLYTQHSSQWDGLWHVRHPAHGFYGWTSDADADDPRGRLGIEHFSAAGIVGRGVLLDVARFLARRGQPLAPDAYYALPAALLDNVAEAEGVELRPGDILLMRTGVDSWIRSGAPAGPADEPVEDYQGPGLEQGNPTLAWLWDRHVAAVVSDNLAVEAWPPPSMDEFLHFQAIPLLGLVFGELFDLEALAENCAADGVYEVCFMAKPLMLRGGVGSTANALALK